MNRHRHTPVLLVAVASLASAGGQPAPDYGKVPLEATDLQEIERQVLAANPILSSSPGIKVAEAYRGPRSNVQASVIWYPHTASGGVEEALQVVCWHSDTEPDWTCNPAEIRRYLRLENQEFTVRLLNNTEPAVALALIEATRSSVEAAKEDPTVIVNTAILIFEYEGSYIVTWGTPEGYQNVSIQARLRPGGNPAKAGAWGVNPYLYPEE